MIFVSDRWTLLLIALLLASPMGCRTPNPATGDSLVKDSSPGACVFGKTTAVLRQDPEFKFGRTGQITSSTRLSNFRKKQIITGMRAASGEAINTVEQALSATDNQKFKISSFRDRVRGGRYFLYEYVGGENVHGWITAQRGGIIAAVVGDENVVNCVVINPPQQPGSGSIADAVDALNACAGNGDGSHTSTYNVASLDVSAEIAKMKQHDVHFGACQEGTDHTYKQGAQGAERFIKVMKTDPYVSACLNSEVAAADVNLVEQALRDATNKAVLVSLFNEGSNSSESCMFWIAKIFRPDGKIIEIEFNETD